MSFGFERPSYGASPCARCDVVVIFILRSPAIHNEPVGLNRAAKWILWEFFGQADENSFLSLTEEQIFKMFELFQRIFIFCFIFNFILCFIFVSFFVSICVSFWTSEQVNKWTFWRRGGENWSTQLTPRLFSPPVRVWLVFELLFFLRTLNCLNNGFAFSGNWRYVVRDLSCSTG